MKKYIILSTNDNPEYAFHVPLCAWAWSKLGWEPIIFLHGNMRKYHYLTAWKNVRAMMPYVNVPEYPSEMITQISRLYGACIMPTHYLMTGDIDMIPLSNYWTPDENTITTYGHDLTNYNHYPICYIGMPATRWIEVMGLSRESVNEMVKRDLDAAENSRHADPAKRWCVDQDVITKKLNDTQFEKVRVNRGTYPNGYAIGRVDRSAWTLEHEQLIDAHLPRGIWHNQQHLDMTLALMEKVWPEFDHRWFTHYVEEFREIVK